MYTYNYFVFGHDFSSDKELNNSISDNDIEFRTVINGNKYEISSPYHGGIVAGDLYNQVVGTIITDDDGNDEYVNEIRTAKESDYIDDYNEFLIQVKAKLNLDIGVYDAELDEDIRKMLEFIDNNEPTFYTVPASS